VKDAILSPHQFGIPQHRKRIYIVGVRKDLGGLGDFHFPEPTNTPCNIKEIIDESDTSITKLKPETYHQLEVWQEFIDHLIYSGDTIPTFPIWAMEFGATYEYGGLAPAYQQIGELNKCKGKLGKKIRGNTIEECLSQLPNYSRTAISREFPNWKKRYIYQNRQLYLKHKEWIDVWLKKVRKFDNSHLKFEWNCGHVNPTLEDKIIQFRASGIRVKLPTYSPALNLVGTQIPIFPWIKLPESVLKEGEQSRGRYLSLKEASALQGMEELRLDTQRENFPLSLTRASEALGNAVNVKIVESIAKKLLKI
jgi:DNA (cytosine-5)-methyltransferase 1